MKIGTAALRRALFDDGPDAVVCVDSEGSVIAANPRAVELFGYDHDELIGLPIESIVYEDVEASQTPQRIYDDPKAQSLSGGLNFVGRRKDGSEFPVGINLSPQQSREGNFVAAIVADLTELRIAEKQLRDSEERYRHLIENTPDGYFISQGGIVNYVNPSAIRMLGAGDATEVTGRPLSDFIIVPADVEAGADAAADAQPYVDRLLRRIDGSTFEAETGSVHVSDNIEQTIIRDLTAKRQAEQLQIRALAAEQSERMKSNLLSTVSHELRTPLTAVRGYASTVLEYADYLEKEEVVEYMQGIDSAAQHLEKIVSDLLTLSRIEGGVYRLDQTDFDAGDFVRSAASAYLIAHPSHVLQIERRAVHPVVHADSTRVLQVLHNLLDNARKYGGEDHPTRVTISSAEHEVILTVHDSGPGVEDEALEQIFQPFVRGSSSREADVAGSGLGLAVCKGIVEAHGGRIWASRPEEGGFSVSFSLPEAA